MVSNIAGSQPSESSHIISAEVFQLFPSYQRGVVVGGNLENGPSSPELASLLRDAEASLRGRLSIEELPEHPRLKPWRDAFRSFGAKPNQFRPSIEALTRRVLRSQPLPLISRLVDIGTLVSLRHLVPVGGHAIDEVKQDLVLRRAIGDESFVPFGSDVPEHPLTGEIIFAEGDTVVTRRWVWRQANHTLVTPKTEWVEINVDALPPVSTDQVQGICEEVAELIARYCGGQTKFEILSKDHPRMRMVA